MFPFLNKLAHLLPLLALATAYYLLLYLPSRMHPTTITNIQIGDKVITKGGLVGVVCHRLKKTLVLELYDGSRVEVIQNSVVSRDNQ